MSTNLKTLADKLKTAPSVTDTSGALMLMTDANGNLKKAGVSLFARTVKMSLRKGEIIRVSNIYSSFIACRGHMGSKAALIWVSSYGDGTQLRMRSVKIFQDSTYEFYVNGASEKGACVYVIVNSENSDYVAVTSLFGETPVLEKVSSLPSGTTTLAFN